MDKYLIITPQNGLCNQLIAIPKGIILGLISKRNVIFKSFQLDYRDFNSKCEFHKIIDINYLQEKLYENNIIIKISSDYNINGTKIYLNNTTEEIPNIKNFAPYLFLDKNIDVQYLDVNCPISFEVPLQYNNIFNTINANIKFEKYYNDIADELKKKLNLQYFTALHLRLEDDAINFMKDMNNNITLEEVDSVCKKLYIEHFDYLKSINCKIYVCSSLGISENKNNEYYKELKNKYDIIDKNDIINVSENNCREIYGIIDFLIAQDALYFIGCDWSSFSFYLHYIFQNNHKDTILLQIWETIKKISKNNL